MSITELEEKLSNNCWNCYYATTWEGTTDTKWCRFKCRLIFEKSKPFMKDGICFTPKEHRGNYDEL